MMDEVQWRGGNKIDMHVHSAGISDVLLWSKAYHKADIEAGMPPMSGCCKAGNVKG